MNYRIGSNDLWKLNWSWIVVWSNWTFFSCQHSTKSQWQKNWKSFSLMWSEKVIKSCSGATSWNMFGWSGCGQLQHFLCHRFRIPLRGNKIEDLFKRVLIFHHSILVFVDFCKRNIFCAVSLTSPTQDEIFLLPHIFSHRHHLCVERRKRTPSARGNFPWVRLISNMFYFLENVGGVEWNEKNKITNFTSGRRVSACVL